MAAEHAYKSELSIGAPRERIFDAIATVAGVRGWWTPIVTAAGDELHVGFEGIDELIVLRQEAHPPSRVRWTCLEHTGAPQWRRSEISFVIGDAGHQRSRLDVTHAGIASELVAPGWQRFLSSLVELVETGVGAPFGHQAPAVARRYHRAWTAGDFAAAAACLADDLQTDVPLNTYASKADFVTALTSFGGLVERTELLCAFDGGDEALLLYDMVTEPFGTIRIAEHFTVRDGLITRIRHVHDTAALRAAGFAPDRA